MPGKEQTREPVRDSSRNRKYSLQRRLVASTPPVTQPINIRLLPASGYFSAASSVKAKELGLTASSETKFPEGRNLVSPRLCSPGGATERAEQALQRVCVYATQTSAQDLGDLSL